MVTHHDFDAFYRANFADTVAMTYAYTGELATAQDIVQETFCRAWQRWSDLQSYDNPVAWVRRVALNIARSRWRHLRVVRAHLVRQRTEAVEPPVPDHVALVTALRTLSEDQRRAIVLHHLMDLPITDVARQMDASEGTVKSWLSRGRTALASRLSDDLRDDMRHAISTPDPATVRSRAERQRTVRRAATSVAAAVLAVLAVVAMAMLQGLPGRTVPGQSPPPPSISPAPQGSPMTQADPADPMRTALSKDTITITLDDQPGCPTGPTSFRHVDTQATTQDYPKMVLDMSTAAVGDLIGDGYAEAAIEAVCFSGPEASGDGNGRILIVTRVGDELRVVGRAGHEGALVPSMWIDGKALFADEHPWHNDWAYRLGEVQSYRWKGTGFVVADSGYQALYPGATLRLGSVLDARKSACAGVAWRDPGPLTFDDQGHAGDGDRIWMLDQPQTPDGSPHLIVAGTPRRVMLLATVTCMAANVLDPALQTDLVLFERDATGWVAVRAFQEARGMTVIGWHMDGDDLIVDIGPIGSGGHSHLTTYPLT